MRVEGHLADDLGPKLTGRVVVVGVGESDHGDDGIGPLVARLLDEAGVQGVIDAGPAPELVTHRIREHRPNTVLFVDAVDFAAAPGDVALLRTTDLRAEGFDTHRAPLRLTMQYLENELGCDCLLLAMQPREVRLGSAMCEEVKDSAERLAQAIQVILNEVKDLGLGKADSSLCSE